MADTRLIFINNFPTLFASKCHRMLINFTGWQQEKNCYSRSLSDVTSLTMCSDKKVLCRSSVVCGLLELLRLDNKTIAMSLLIQQTYLLKNSSRNGTKKKILFFEESFSSSGSNYDAIWR